MTMDSLNMKGRNYMRKFYWVVAIVLLLLVSSNARAVPLVIDPDDFPNNTILNNAFKGVTLTTVGLTNTNVLSLTNSRATTGTRVFGNTVGSAWGDNSFEFLRADFLTGATWVSLDFAANDSNDRNPFLRAYDSNDVLVDSVTGGFVPLGSPVTLMVSAPNIAYIIASWDDLNRKDNGILDNLRFEPGSPYNIFTFLPDLNGNGSQEIAVLDQTYGTSYNSRVLIKDSDTGAILRTIPCLKFGFLARDMKRINDFDQSGTPALAVLGERPQASSRVEVINPVTGNLFRAVQFRKDYSPKSVVFLKDINNNGFPELAVLGTRASDGSSMVQIRDASTSELLKNIRVGMTNIDRCLDMEFMVDMNGNGSQELAVLQSDEAHGIVQIRIFDTLTGKVVKTVRCLSPNYIPFALVWLKDMNGNAMPELGVLGTGIATKIPKVEVVDVLMGSVLNTLIFSKAYSPMDAASVDMEGDKVSEVGVLGIDSSGNTKVEIRNCQTNELVKRISIP